MPNYGENELISRLQVSEDKFTIPLDKTTDIGGLAILLVILRHFHETAAQEDMLICKSLPTKTSTDENFNLIDSCFKKYFYVIMY